MQSQQRADLWGGGGGWAGQRPLPHSSWKPGRHQRLLPTSRGEREASCPALQELPDMLYSTSISTASSPHTVTGPPGPVSPPSTLRAPQARSPPLHPQGPPRPSCHWARPLPRPARPRTTGLPRRQLHRRFQPAGPHGRALPPHTPPALPFSPPEAPPPHPSRSQWGGKAPTRPHSPCPPLPAFHFLSNAPLAPGPGWATGPPIGPGGEQRRAAIGSATVSVILRGIRPLGEGERE